MRRNTKGQNQKMYEGVLGDWTHHLHHRRKQVLMLPSDVHIYKPKPNTPEYWAWNSRKESNKKKKSLYSQRPEVKKKRAEQQRQRLAVEGVREKVNQRRKELYENNKEAYKITQHKWYALNKIRERAKLACRRYGVSIEWYFKKVINGKCEVCGITNKKHNDIEGTNLNIDHCHKTGGTRGVLCTCCNLALGYVKDNQKILKGLSNYLRGDK
jgi:hypothetical protein